MFPRLYIEDLGSAWDWVRRVLGVTHSIASNLVISNGSGNWRRWRPRAYNFSSFNALWGDFDERKNTHASKNGFAKNTYYRPIDIWKLVDYLFYHVIMVSIWSIIFRKCVNDKKKFFFLCKWLHMCSYIIKSLDLSFWYRRE